MQLLRAFSLIPLIASIVLAANPQHSDYASSYGEQQQQHAYQDPQQDYGQQQLGRGGEERYFRPSDLTRPWPPLRQYDQNARSPPQAQPQQYDSGRQYQPAPQSYGQESHRSYPAPSSQHHDQYGQSNYNNNPHHQQQQQQQQGDARRDTQNPNAWQQQQQQPPRFEVLYHQAKDYIGKEVGKQVFQGLQNQGGDMVRQLIGGAME